MEHSEPLPRKARRKPGGGKGPRTEAQLERQAKVFALYVDRKSIRDIALIEQINPKTVMDDIRAEADARKDQRREVRDHDTEIQLEKIDALINEALALSGKAGVGGLAAATKLLEMRGKILGLEAPIKIDTGLDEFVKALTSKGE